jgi:hypothetical protein
MSGRDWYPMRSASPKPGRDRQRQPLALALQQRVGGDGRAHLHHQRRGRPPRLLGQDRLDPGRRGILILAGIVGQELAHHHRPSGAARRCR